LHHAKAMRSLQPELKKIKAAAKGDRQKESALTMELYKEKEINPFSSIGILLVQFPILIGLYSSIRRLIDDPHQIISFSYPALHHLPWMESLSHDIHRFDSSLFGLVNLTRTASGPHGIYWPAIIIVAASAIAQYLQSKQLMPSGKDARSLRSIMREAGTGNKADQSEVSAAVSRSTLIFIPLIVFLVSLHLAVALPLYWLVSSTIAYFQQARVLEGDVTEAEVIASAPSGTKKKTADEVKVTRNTVNEPSKTKKSSKAPSKKRRKR
jgi:YidC/Oxa1 family membrane protein insertase